MPALPCRYTTSEILPAREREDNMPLKLRPTGLGSGIDKDRPDYAVYYGGWDGGRIYQTRGGPDSLRWFWSLTVKSGAAIILLGPR